MTRKIAFFEGWSCFKFNNLGLALGTNLKCYTSVTKELKLKARKFWGLIPTFLPPLPLPHVPHQSRVKKDILYFIYKKWIVALGNVSKWYKYILSSLKIHGKASISTCGNELILNSALEMLQDSHKSIVIWLVLPMVTHGNIWPHVLKKGWRPPPIVKHTSISHK